MSGRPFPWETLYPPGLRWDAPLRILPLPTLLDEAVAAYGDRPAFEFNGVRTSYRTLGAQVDRAAAGLARLGVGPGVAVALYLPNTPYHPIAFFATLRAGGRVVHLSPLDPPRVLAGKLADSGARILVTTNVPGMIQAAQALLADGAADWLIVGDNDAFPPGLVPSAPMPEGAGVVPFERLYEAPAPASWPKIGVEEVAVLQYTGGTTGLPRAAMLTHANLSAATSIYHVWYDGIGRRVQPDDRCLAVLPLFHIYALTTILLRGIEAGIEILLRPRFDVETTLRDIEQGRVTIFPGVPTMWIALNAHPGVDRRDFSSLRTVSSGGAPLPTEVAERLESITRHALGGGWGMTETSPAGTSLLPGQKNAPGLIGVPLPGIEMDVVALDDPRRILPPGEKGEIRIKGPNVITGYWNRPEESASAFADGYFLTGDVGYMDADGVFFLVDRKKDMIISGGFNVYPGTIEQAIYEHPAVQEVIVIGVPDRYRGQAAKAYVTLREGADPIALDELRAFLADKVGRHELPAALELRDSLPKTPVGKLSKKELVDEARAQFAAANPPPSP